MQFKRIGLTYYLWMNDDLCPAVTMPSDELVGLADKCADSGQTRAIVVGRLISPTHGQQTYGGLVRVQGLSRLRFRPARVDEACCSTMNGNCVLIPAAAVTHIGLNSRVYRHSFGDVDYGLRAVRGGLQNRSTHKPLSARLSAIREAARCLAQQTGRSARFVTSS